MGQRPVGGAPDDEARDECGEPAPSCWIAALNVMKLPRSRGSTLPDTSAIAGPKRPGTSTKNSTDAATTCGSGSGGRCVVTKSGTTERIATIPEHPPLAVPIGQAADDLRR